MNDRSTILIWNPRAGRGRARRRASEVERFCETLAANRISIVAAPTTAPNDATRLAREAVERGVREIIVAGGDGTLNEVLQAVVGAPGVRLGVWARGTSNVLARELSIPFAAGDAARIIARAHTRRIHVGCATFEIRASDSESRHAPTHHTGERRYFFLMAGVGHDAAIVNRVSPSLKRRVGEAAFWYAGLAHLARWRSPAFTVESGGASHQATFAAVGKTPRYGGNLHVTPGASPDHPHFRLLVVDTESRVRYVRLLLAALHRGVAEQAPHARLLDTTRVRIRDARDRATLVQLDGELAGRPPVTLEIAEHPIEIYTPTNQHNP